MGTEVTALGSRRSMVMVAQAGHPPQSPREGPLNSGTKVPLNVVRGIENEEESRLS